VVVVGLSVVVVLSITVGSMIVGGGSVVEPGVLVVVGATVVVVLDAAGRVVPGPAFVERGRPVPLLVVGDARVTSTGAAGSASGAVLGVTTAPRTVGELEEGRPLVPGPA
jgi:hypothetical protein